MRRPVIFLDIDGVIAVRPGTPRGRQRLEWEMRRQGLRVPKAGRVLAPACIAHLNTLLAACRAELVVSSSWRLRGDIRPELYSAGVEGDFHDHWATDADGPDRGAEITRWLAVHGPAGYVVLDDWAPGLEAHTMQMVQVDFRVGLTAEDVERAREVLARRPEQAWRLA